MLLSDFTLDFQIDLPSINYIRSRSAQSLVVDAINGVVSIKTLWTQEIAKSKYKPANDVLAVNAVVLGPFFDELIEASLRIFNSQSGEISASLHGTPLELSFRYDENFITVQLIEYIDYSDDERIIGAATTSRKLFLATVTALIEAFLSRTMSENPFLTDNPTILSFQKELTVLRKGLDTA